MRSDVVADVLHLLRPPLVVCFESLFIAVRRQVVEAALGEVQSSAAFFRGLQVEFDKGGYLFGVIDVRVDRVGMPGKGEILRWIDLLNDDPPGDLLVSWFR